MPAEMSTDAGALELHQIECGDSATPATAARRMTIGQWGPPNAVASFVQITLALSVAGGV